MVVAARRFSILLFIIFYVASGTAVSQYRAVRAARRVFYAVRAGVRGEIKPAEAATNIAWQSSQIKPHIVTPIVYEGHLYVCTDNGILSQYKATTGEPTFRARLGSGGSFSASPVAADGKLYFASEDGDVFVIKAGPAFELLARNTMGEVVMATPAIGGKMIIIRGQNHIFGIAKTQGPVVSGMSP